MFISLQNLISKQDFLECLSNKHFNVLTLQNKLARFFMTISINGKLAYLKENTSFEYITENRLFTGSDSYTLTITFPLKDCPQNISIFGHLHRQDVEKEKIVFDCDIRDRNFIKSGTITVTEITKPLKV